MTKLRYVGPIDEVEVGGVVAKRGEVVTVPTAIAGQSPDPRLAAAMLELDAAITALDHNRAAALRDEIVALDPGSGLLAQSTWELVKTGKTEDES